MSDASDQGSRDMSRTLLGGSEEDYAVVCDPCKFDNQHVEAKAYCTNCNENMCAACIKVHGKMPGLRDHVIETEVRSQSRKGKAGKPTPPTDNDPLTDTCEQHQQEIVKFYCNNHNTLGCGVCLPFDHKNCTDISYIRDVSDGIADSDELNNVRSELRQAAARLRFSKSNIGTTKERLAQRYNETLEEIDNFQEEIINYVHEVADDARQEATRLRDEALKESDEQAATCEELVDETEEMTTDMDTRSKSGLNNGLYVAMKRAKAKLPGLQKKTRQFSSIAPSKFVFKREVKLQDLMTSMVGLGKVTITKTPRNAKFVQDLDVSSDTDTHNCHFTAISVVSGERLAVVDNKNKALKLVDVKQSKVIDKISTSSSPIGITTFENDTVAVTLRGERIIQVFSLAPKLSKHRAIKVQHLYGGIVYGSDIFALTPQSAETDKTIHICDASGKLVKNIELPIQKPSSRIALDPVQDVMYVSNYGLDTVVCIDMSGTLIRTHSHKDVKSPRGIVLDEDGYVYVCSEYGRCIHQMIPGAGTGKPILTEEHGIQYPMAIAYSQDHLYISSSSNDISMGNFIKMFKLC